MQYKAVLFDVDGTAVPNEQHALPSPLLVKTVAQAQTRVHVCAATGRIYATARWVIDALKLTDPCIVSSGAEIIQPQSGVLLWKKQIPKATVAALLTLLAPYPFEVLVSSQFTTFPPQPRGKLQDESIIYIMEVPVAQRSEIRAKLQRIPQIVIHEATGYIEDRVTFNITHQEATKLHAVHELTKLMGVTKEEIIAVGDSANDLPLFAAAGLKVAMGNATDELKQNADVVTASVYEDGLAQIIQKYILS